MEERGQVGKIILDPRMTKGDLLPVRDNYVLAVKNVEQRQQLMKQSDFTGVLVDDKAFENEEDEHIKRLEHEEMLRYNDYHGPGLMPNLIPIGNASFFRTEEGDGPFCYVNEPGVYFPTALDFLLLF